ncbi:MAG: hypothetical protein KAR42_11665 [candidate division Zixibacteria bacterium]|nr:hypothetical protein [candidate division Zixibacteria bacterium]
MKNRRMRPFANMETGTWLKTGSIVYLSMSLILLVITAVIYLNIDSTSLTSSGSFFTSAITIIPIIMWVGYLAGLIFMVLTMRKCTGCILGPGKRLTSAMDKMSRGDLGWRLTLRRGDEMMEVADSVSKASQSLAGRISKMQSEIKGLTEVEEYLIDSVAGSHHANPYFMKALRKLKISTNRLHADINDFQISLVEEPISPKTRVNSYPHRMQSVGGQ